MTTATFSAAFAAHIATGNTTLCWCWRVTRTDATVFGFTDHDAALTVDGTSFAPGTGGFNAAELVEANDLEVDAQAANGFLNSSQITETDILAGKWDAATVEIFRVNWSDPTEYALRRKGTIGEISRGRVAFNAEIRSQADVLTHPQGRTFQYTCGTFLGSSLCGVDLESASFKGAGTVSTLNRGREFVATGLGSYADGLFRKGTVEWLTGANAGLTMRVERHQLDGTDAIFTLAEEPINAVAVSDTFDARAGCDLHPETCDGTFSNIANYRGFPYMPGASIQTYAGNDGNKTGDGL